MELNILQELCRKVEDGISGALVTLTESKGSVPRKEGTIMGVWHDSFLGTIGGGMIEHRVIELAKEQLLKEENAEFSFDLTKEAELGMSCGGSVKGYIKVFKPKNRIVILGAGHIGENLYNLLKGSDFQVEILDDRESYKDKYENIKIGSFSQEIKKLKNNPKTYFVIVTKGHGTDLEAIKEIIENKSYSYIGMVGSKKKVIEIKNEIEKTLVWDEKIYSPIGLKISNGTPYEIAVEILAEILSVKNKGELKHRRIEC